MEPEFTNHIKTITDNSVSTYDTAARHAKDNGAMYCRVFTCTPGDLDTAMGLEAQYLLNATRPWTERFYDWTEEQIDEYIKAGESNRIVYIEYHYYQIGLTEEWLEDIAAKINDPLVVRREILLQRLHGSSSSPYPKEDIEYLADIQKKPIKSIWLLDFYEFFVYKEIDPGIPYILGIDCSTGTNSDHNAITAINPYTMEPELEFQCNYIGETLYERVIIELVTKIMPRAIVCIERNSVGDGIIDHLLHSKIAHRLYYDKAKDLVADNMHTNESVESMLKKQAADKKFYGVYTEGTSRQSMFAILSNHIANYKEKFVTKFITEDISRLVKTSSGKVVAGPGFHDDNIMSYLIAMYVFYHGNNLPAFGFVPGSQEIKNKNMGINHYSEVELKKVLPDAEVRAIQEQREVAKIMDYEALLRETLAREQAHSMSLLNSSLNISSNTYDVTTDVSPYDDDGEIPLSMFDQWNI